MPNAEERQSGDMTEHVADVSETERLIEEIEGLRAQVAQLQARVEQLDELAHQDSLICLPNRRGFMRAIERFIDRAKRYDERSAMLFVDLDGAGRSDRRLRLHAQRRRPAAQRRDRGWDDRPGRSRRDDHGPRRRRNVPAESGGLSILPPDFWGRGTIERRFNGGGVFHKLAKGPSIAFGGPPPLQMQGRMRFRSNRTV